MKKYTIIATATFENDLNLVVEYYVSKGSSYGFKLVNKVQEIVSSLDESPERCAILPEDYPNKNNKNPNIRHCICDNYRILYQVKGDKVIILTILGQNLLNFDRLELY